VAADNPTRSLSPSVRPVYHQRGLLTLPLLPPGPGGFDD